MVPGAARTASCCPSPRAILVWTGFWTSWRRGSRERLHTLAARFRAGREAHPAGRGPFGAVRSDGAELEIAGLAAQRKSSREIAEILSISVKSVNNRLNAVYEKLGLGGEGRNKRQALAKLMKIS